MGVDVSKTVRELAVEFPATTRVFESLGIDYCCAGGQSLEAACYAAKLPVTQVLASVESVIGVAPRHSGQQWNSEPLVALTSYIVSTHHGYVKAELPRLERLLVNNVAAHREAHPELVQIKDTFTGLAQELTMHMMKEEQVLFPYIDQLEAAANDDHPYVPPQFGSVRNPVQMMLMEHDSAGEDLRRIRALTKEFSVPSDACPSFQALYRGLQEFEADLHQHIHLENNILFPRAIELEKQKMAVSQNL